MRRFFIPITAALTVALSLSVPMAARADAPSETLSGTPWQDHEGMVRTRLVAASAGMADSTGAPLYAWEADLAPGWKTYWRSPGEAGLPVRISEGKTPVDILFPLPDRFTLFGIETTGYHNRVMLPFRLAQGAAPGTDIRVDFMVCKDICVPMEATYALPATPDVTGDDIRIQTWLDRVPARAGDGGAGLTLTTVRLMGTVGHQRLIVDVAAADSLDAADLFAEAGGMVHFGAPTKKLLADGKSARFVLMPMMGNRPFDLKDHAVRFTFTDGHGHAIDRTLTVGTE